MSPPRRRRLLTVAVSVLVLAGALVTSTTSPASARTSAGSSGEAADRAAGVLSGRLQTLARPTIARANPTAQARALSLPATGSGALVRDEGRVLVQVLLADTAPPTIAALRQVAEVINVSPAMSRATILIAPDELTTLSTVSGVDYADVIPAPIQQAGTASGARALATAPSLAGRCHPLRSEADSQLRAAAARRAAHVDGTGVTIGVLSDSYDADRSALTPARDDVASGALPGTGNPCGYPTPVHVVAEFQPDDPSSPTDEGRAMLQGVHALAPGAALAFATASGGPDVMAANIARLRKAGADVIVDDISYLTEPFFQQGVIDRAVSKVVASGASYFSSAGNSNAVLGGKDVSSWETPAVHLNPCPALNLDPVAYGPIGSCVGFAPGGSDTGYDLTLGPGGTISPVLQWAEPVGGVTDDFDMFVVDPGTLKILASSTDVQASSKSPVEFLSWTNTAATPRHVEIVINRFSGQGTPRLKLSFLSMTHLVSLQYKQSAGPNIVGPTVFGHNGGVDVTSVAAVPYDNSGVVEPYSSRGPDTLYFGPVKGTRPAARLPVPLVVHAPQIAASDGTPTTFFGQRAAGVYRFYGTSAAAPAAAAVAALMEQQDPSLTPAQTRAVLRLTARPVGSATVAAVGSGLVDARRAVAYVGAPPTPTVTATRARQRAVKVSFAQAPASALTAPTTSYQARCTSSHGGTTGRLTRAGAGTAPMRVAGLSRGKTYRCQVRARTAYVAGAYSAKGPAALARGVPNRPTRVQAVPGAGSTRVVVTFQAPGNTGGRALTGFLAQCTPVGGGARQSRSTASAQARSLTVRHLVAGTRYGCVVFADNALGRSKPSSAARVTTGR